MKKAKDYGAKRVEWFVRRRRSLIIMSPWSSEDWIPLVWVDLKFRFRFLHIRKPSPFGLYIRVPFLGMRWGSA